MKRTLPVLLAVLAIAVLLSMMHFLQNAPRAAAPNSAVSTDITMPLHVLVDKEDAPAMEVVLSHRGETVTYVQDAQVYKAKGYDDRLSFDQTSLRNLFSACSRLLSRKIIDAQPEDLSTYGMEDPVCMVRITYADGEKHVIRIGNRSPLEDGYFGTLDDDPAIHLLTTYDVDLFLKTLKDYRSFSLLHPLGSEAEAYSLTVRELCMDRGEGGKISLYRAPDSVNGDIYNIQILEPVEVNGSEYDFLQKVVKPLFSLSHARVELVEDLPNELSRYGLDSPRTLYVRDDAGATRLMIGDEENGRTYLMREGVPAVLSVETSALNFLNLDYAQIMDRLVWLYNIDQVQNLTVEHAGVTDVLEIRNEGKDFLFNGVFVADDVGRALYRNAISLEFDGRTNASMDRHIPECRLIITLNDGRREELTLYRLNERHLEVARNGSSTGFYTSQKGLQEIINVLEALRKQG